MCTIFPLILVSAVINPFLVSVIVADDFLVYMDCLVIGCVLQDVIHIERVPALKQPVLVLGAEDDGVLGPQAAKALAAALKDNPHASCHIYEPGYGHAAYDTAPDFGERMYTFFKAEP